MGPLTEIDFWRRRSRNISGINEQIKHPVRMNASWVVFVSIKFFVCFFPLQVSPMSCIHYMCTNVPGA
jgi:hypothetical protein